MNQESSKELEFATRLKNVAYMEYAPSREQLAVMIMRFGETEITMSELLQDGSGNLGEMSPVGDPKSNAYYCRVSKKAALDASGPRSDSQEEPSDLGLEVCCLGRFRVMAGSREIDHWQSLKAKALLKYLISRTGHSASRDILMEDLWPGCEPTLANKNLRAAVRTLRKTLNSTQGANEEAAWVWFRHGEYMISPKVHLYVDVEQFEHHYHAGRLFEKAGKTDESMSEYRATAALYKGDYLQDDICDDWTSLIREDLKDRYLSILSRLADYAVRKANHEHAVMYCQEILRKDYCREDAYRCIMRCYSRMGQRNRAMEWYRLCEKIVRNELDAPPDRQSVALYQKLLRDEDI